MMSFKKRMRVSPKIALSEKCIRSSGNGVEVIKNMLERVMSDRKSMVKELTRSRQS